MPKQRITRDMILDAAFALLREGGEGQVLVKNIAQALGCSVQPIYTYFSNMQSLHKAVQLRASAFVGEYLRSHIDPADLFRSTGHAYVRLAGEEPAIFRLHVLRQRENVDSFDALYRQEAAPEMAAYIAQSLRLSLQDARALHLNMLIYSIGISTILANAAPGIPTQEAQQQLDAAFEVFLSQHKREET